MSNEINPYNAGASFDAPSHPIVGDVREVTFELQMEDVLALSIYQYRTSPFFRGRRRIVYLVCPVLLLTMAWLLVESQGRWTDAVFGLIALAAVIFVLGSPPIYQRLIRRNTAKVYAEGSNRALLSMRQVRIDPAFFTQRSELMETIVRWAAVERIVVEKDYAYVFIAAYQAFILPRKAFPGDQQFHSFVETSRNYWQRARDAKGPAA
jgi:hypothetical protein